MQWSEDGNGLIRPVELLERAARDRGPQWKDITIGELIQDYDPVSVPGPSEPGAIIVAERPVGQAVERAMQFDTASANTAMPGTLEQLSKPGMGPAYGGGTLWGYFGYGEYNRKLWGHQGIRVFDEMKRSDAEVRVSLLQAKVPILSGRWYIQPYDEKKRSKTIASMIQDQLFKRMAQSWFQTLFQALHMQDYGFALFEKVWEFVPSIGQIVLSHLAPIHPLDIAEGNIKYDAYGRFAGVVLGYGNDEVPIPRSKLLVFTHMQEGMDICGVSLLRSAYKHWYFKENLYKIDAIQKERHGIGIPIIKLPIGYNETDKALADQMGRNLRTNEKAHIVLPPMWEIMFAELKGQPVDCVPSIEHHNGMIRRNIGSPQNDKDVDWFLRLSRYSAEIIKDEFNKQAIPQLVAWNRMTDEFPELAYRRIGETTDWRTFSFALRNLVGAKLLRVDKDLLDYIRNELDLPPEDEESIMELIQEQLEMAQQAMQQQGQAGDTPQDPSSRVGPPRQSQAGNQRIQPPAAGSGRTGDRSGG